MGDSAGCASGAAMRPVDAPVVPPMGQRREPPPLEPRGLPERWLPIAGHSSYVRSTTTGAVRRVVLYPV